MATPPELECRFTAGLLRSADPLVMACHAAAIAVGFHMPSAAGLAALVAWCVVVVLAVRVRLDAAVFEAMAGDPAEATGRFDEFLKRTGLRANIEPRDLAARCRGAVRLWKLLAAAAALELALAGLALIWAH